MSEPSSRDASSRDTALEALDTPLDGSSLQERLARPGMARSTRILLAVAAAVILFGLGALVGRLTAPATTATAPPAAVGVVDGIDRATGSPLITVREADGSTTTVRTTAGTVVAVPRPGGPGGVSTGEQVTVTSEIGPDGALTATRIDVPR